MSASFSRRQFAAAAAGIFVAADTQAAEPSKPATPMPAANPATANRHAGTLNPGPVEAPFERDYPAPDFKPSWKRPQLPRQLVQDFVIYAHSDLAMTQKLLTKEPGLIAATVNWGAGDWESGFNGAAHMGRRDIVGYLLENGARIDIFCAAMLGQLEVVQTFLKFEPKLIDAKGPHGFTLHFHAQVGGKEAEPVLDYLQSVKKLELRPIPFMTKPKEPAKS
jgi:hypothetical protein